MASALQDEFDYYLSHQAELVKEYDGMFVAIKDGQVLGAYKDELEAIYETKKKHELGTFLIQKVTPGDDAYKQTFHSRVVFT